MWAGTRPAGAKLVPAQGHGHVDFGSPSLGLLPPQKGLKLTLGLSGAGDVPSPVLQAAALPEQSRQAAVGRGWPWAQLVEARAGGSGTTRATSSSSQTEDPNRQGRGRRGELRSISCHPLGCLRQSWGLGACPRSSTTDRFTDGEPGAWGLQQLGWAAGMGCKVRLWVFKGQLCRAIGRIPPVPKTSARRTLRGAGITPVLATWRGEGEERGEGSLSTGTGRSPDEGKDGSGVGDGRAHL